MNASLHKRREAGFTLIEMMISVSILAATTLIVSTWVTKPTKVFNMIMTVNMQKIAGNAANIFATDLQTADPTSINWNNLLFDQISFTQPQFDFYVPNTTLPALSVQYRFSPSANGLGSLIRNVGGVQTVLLNNVVAPTATSPLVQVDTASVAGMPLYNMMILSFTCQPPGLNQAISVTRRVAITG